MKSIKREIISRETIKPSSPTPPHLRSYKLSLLDQFAPNLHVRFGLFYPRPRDHDHDDHQPKFRDGKLLLLEQLKKSLSQVLTLHYPFAGRFRNRISIDCNDEGVELIESRINCDLSEILNDPASSENLDLFFSTDLLKATPDLLLIIQVSILDCQGLVIGVSFSHVIADAATMSTFMTDWASKARLLSGPLGHEDQDISPPQLIAASVFPPLDTFTMPEFELEMETNVVTKRFVFDASSIAALKEMAAIGTGMVQNPTRVELVTAFLLTCAVGASAAVSGYVKEACAIQAVNLRRRMIPPLPSNAFGNMTSCLVIKTTTDEEIELSKMVRKLRDSKENFDKMQVLKTTGQAWIPFVFQTMQELAEEKNLYIVTSWCRFGFYDDVDFGWGKPIWLGMASNAGYKNTITLTDTRLGDGIEAVVCLEQQEMALVERDADVLLAASASAVRD